MNNDNLKDKTINGVKWTTISTIVLAIAGLLKISVLARFLEPSDFGLMALITFVLGFLNLFMDMGLTSAILHKQDISKSEYSSLFFLNIIFSLILFCLIVLVSPIFASFYKETELAVLIPLMSISIIISALGGQFKTVEQKNLNFKFISSIDIPSAFAGLISGVVLAYFNFGVYALVYSALIQYALSNMTYFIKGVSKKRIVFHFNFRETKRFLKIGIYQVGGQFINYMNRDLDVLIIGKFFGADVLGGYSLAKQLVRRPLQIINPIVTKVGISVLPRFQNDNKLLRRFFLKLFNGLGSINAFVYGFAAIMANYLVLLFYGEEFLKITKLVQWFAILIFLRSMGNLVGLLVITKGRTDYEFYWNIMVSLLMPASIIIGVMYSVEVVIILMAIVQILLVIPSWFIFYKRLINLNLFAFIKVNFSYLIIAALFVLLSQAIFINSIIWKFTTLILMGVILCINLFRELEEFRYLIRKIKMRLV
ncbi:MAG: MOP flippase family protein [Calditrichaceae bacterium]